MNERKQNKILAFAMSVVMTFLCLCPPATIAFAAEENVTENYVDELSDFYKQSNNNYVTENGYLFDVDTQTIVQYDITAFLKEMAEDLYSMNDLTQLIENVYSRTLYLKIPESINGQTVRFIGNGAFKDAPVVEVELPNTIEKIGAKAFEGSSLEKIILNEGLKEIGDCAFDNTALDILIIPETVKKVGYTFVGNKTYAKGPDTLFEEVFYTTNSNTPTQIRELYCIEGGLCDQSISLSNKYYVSENDFPEQALSEIKNNTDENKVDLSDKEFFDQYTDEQGITYGYCKIGENDSENEKALVILDYDDSSTSIVIPEEVSFVKSAGVLSNLSNLEEATISANTLGNIIAKQKLQDNDSLFKACNKLKAINLICEDENDIMSTVAAIKVNLVNKEIVNIISDSYIYENDCLFSADKTTLYGVFSNETVYTVPDSVIGISSFAFTNCKMDKVDLNQTGALGPAVFLNADIKEIELGNVIAIPSFAFLNCSVTEITIPDTVKSIDELAFTGSMLISLTIPETVTQIGNAAFGCENLKTLNYEVNTSVMENGGGTIAAYCPRLETIYLGKNVYSNTSLGEYDGLSQQIGYLPSLKNIEVHKENPEYESKKGILMRKKNLWGEYSNVATGYVLIPNGRSYYELNVSELPLIDDMLDFSSYIKPINVLNYDTDLKYLYQNKVLLDVNHLYTAYQYGGEFDIRGEMMRFNFANFLHPIYLQSYDSGSIASVLADFENDSWFSKESNIKIIDDSNVKIKIDTEDKAEEIFNVSVIPESLNSSQINWYNATSEDIEEVNGTTYYTGSNEYVAISKEAANNVTFGSSLYENNTLKALRICGANSCLYYGYAYPFSELYNSLQLLEFSKETAAKTFGGTESDYDVMINEEGFISVSPTNNYALVINNTDVTDYDAVYNTIKNIVYPYVEKIQSGWEYETFVPSTSWDIIYNLNNHVLFTDENGYIINQEINKEAIMDLENEAWEDWLRYVYENNSIYSANYGTLLTPDMCADFEEYKSEFIEKMMSFDTETGTMEWMFCPGTDCVIPASVNGVPVKNISYMFRSFCDNAGKLYIPSSVEHIGTATGKEFYNIYSKVMGEYLPQGYEFYNAPSSTDNVYFLFYDCIAMQEAYSRNKDFYLSEMLVISPLNTHFKTTTTYREETDNAIAYAGEVLSADGLKCYLSDGVLRNGVTYEAGSLLIPQVSIGSSHSSDAEYIGTICDYKNITEFIHGESNSIVYSITSDDDPSGNQEVTMTLSPYKRTADMNGYATSGEITVTYYYEDSIFKNSEAEMGIVSDYLGDLYYSTAYDAPLAKLIQGEASASDSFNVYADTNEYVSVNIGVPTNTREIVLSNSYDRYKDIGTIKIAPFKTEADVYVPLKRGTVNITSVNADTDETIYQTIDYNIFSVDGTLYKTISSENGVASLQDIPYGEYYITQNECEGFEAPKEESYFAITEDGQIVNVKISLIPSLEYTITIPETITAAELNENIIFKEVSIDDAQLRTGETLKVNIAFSGKIINENDRDISIPYTVQSNGKTINSGDTVASVSYESWKDTPIKSSIGIQLAEEPVFSGKYSDTAVFTVDVSKE